MGDDYYDWWAAALMFPGDEQYYLVERDDDGVPVKLTPIERPLTIKGLRMKFRVAWEEWTGSVWMRRYTDAQDEAGALNFHNGNLWGQDIRNLCIEEVDE